MNDLKVDVRFFGHANNIAQKSRTAPDSNLQCICTEVQAKYERWIAQLFLDQVANGDFRNSVNALDAYVNYTKFIEKEHKFFNWRSDFAGSVIPEYLYRVIADKCHRERIPVLFSTRGSVVELTLSGSVPGAWSIRKKNQDLCLGLKTATVVINEVPESFVVPDIVFEVKTNIDINKLNGLDFSAERLKRSFPAALYILLTETIDFSLKDNYASGSIDEIYVCRKQLRSLSRRHKAPLCADVFAKLTSDVVALMKKASTERGHVYDRLLHGKLINVG